ncbi:MAG: hypothetical protein ACFFCL_14270 [Promethearchaeota archaeon]
MNRKKEITLLSIILLLTNLNIIIINKSVADPAPIPITSYSGGLLPKENVTLSLISANVLIDADTSNLKYLGGISFNGNYTIFNPDDDINLTIGAPFEFYPVENCTVLVNDTSIPYSIIHDHDIDEEYDSEIWNQYIYNRSLVDQGFWVLCNISINRSTYMKLQYIFNIPKPEFPYTFGYYRIIYDVGTARLWNGNVTETVKIRTHGNIPNSIYNEDLCVISDISDGKCYQWDWNEEKIEINYVGLNYYFDFQNEYNYVYYSMKIMLIFVPPIFGVIIILINKLYKRKRD